MRSRPPHLPGRARVRAIVALTILWCAAPAPLYPQDGFGERLLAVPDTASTRQMTYDLTRVPHVAGTPAQALTRDYVIGKLRAWGLEAWTKEYVVYIPQPDSVAAWLVVPGRTAVPLALREPVVPREPATRGPQVPAFNGYAGDGDVTAEVVYVNYG